jgi:hypothetical protein
MFGTRVYLNGQMVGEHVPCFTPGWFDVRPFLRGGGQDNELIIRVGASPENLPAGVANGFDFEKKVYTPGIYDSVELILAGSPEIVRVQTVPDIEGHAVRVVATLRGQQAGSTKLSGTVREAAGGKVMGTAESEAVSWAANHETTGELRIPIRDCQLWSPEKPFLYEVEVSSGQDVLRTRFGMRTFHFDKANGRALLNGRPYYLRGTNVCFFRFCEDAGRGDKAWRRDWVRKLHEAFRRMNWNSARYCIGFPPEFWYDIADETGFLIEDEFPIWYGGDRWPAGLKSEDLTREYREWMQERWNHPSVVIWDAQNETVTEQTGKAIQAVRGLDLSNRPWDNGWSAPQADTDEFECHPYVNIQRTATLLDMPGLPATHLGNPRPNTRNNPMIINEYGWLWLNRDGTPTTLTRGVYDLQVGATATANERREFYARRLAAKTEYWRATRRFAGVLHFCGLSYSRPDGQTSDNFVELDTLAFEPAFERYVRDAFAPVGVMVDYWGEELISDIGKYDFRIVITNDLDEPFSGEVTVSFTGPDGEYRETRASELEPLAQEQRWFPLRIPAKPGRYQLVAELKPLNGEVVRSWREVNVITREQKRAKEGLARGKRPSASSVVTVNGESFPAQQAFDGDGGTRWSSEFSDPQWIAVDLGSAADISSVQLDWENAYAKAYAIQVSADGSSWKEVYATDDGKGGREVIRFAPTSARWVRMYGTKRATQYGYSLWDFKVMP